MKLQTKIVLYALSGVFVLGIGAPNLISAYDDLLVSAGFALVFIYVYIGYRLIRPFIIDYLKGDSNEKE